MSDLESRVKVLEDAILQLVQAHTEMQDTLTKLFRRIKEALDHRSRAIVETQKDVSTLGDMIARLAADSLDPTLKDDLRRLLNQRLNSEPDEMPAVDLKIIN